MKRILILGMAVMFASVSFVNAQTTTQKEAKAKTVANHETEAAKHEAKKVSNEVKHEAEKAKSTAKHETEAAKHEAKKVVNE